MVSTVENNQNNEAYGHLPIINIAGDLFTRAGSMLPPRTIRDYELLFFPDPSQSIYSVNGVEYTLNEPSFVMTRPGEFHHYQYDANQPTRHLFIHFSLPEQQDLFPPLPLLEEGGQSVIASNDELLVGMLKQILNIAYSNEKTLNRRGGALLLALLEELNYLAEQSPHSNMEQRMSPQIQRAIDHLEKYLNTPLTIEELAEKAGWTYEHFSRTFVKHTGRSPKEMIIHRRIERACEQLLHEQKSVKEIAYSVGFTDVNYFYRVFKQLKGITAIEYRKKYYNSLYSELHPVSQGDMPYPPNRILFNVWTRNRSMQNGRSIPKKGTKGEVID